MTAGKRPGKEAGPRSEAGAVEGLCIRLCKGEQRESIARIPRD